MLQQVVEQKPAAELLGGDDGDKDTKPTIMSSDNKEDNAKALLKKRKVALYLAYVGHGYHGMQRNPGAKTIEDDLFRAIHKAGGISEANADEDGFTKVRPIIMGKDKKPPKTHHWVVFFSAIMCSCSNLIAVHGFFEWCISILYFVLFQIHWMRCARTDKGVSAICQVVSLMMVLHPPGMLERINDNLPPCIRVLGYHRVVKGFDARKACHSRRYEYIFPAWMFDPSVRPVRVDVGQTDEAVEENSSAPAEYRDDNEDESRQKTQIRTKLSDRDPNFVFDEGCVQRLSNILKEFEGAHNFHNFTVKMPATAPQAKRYILSFECKGCITIEGEPWVKMVVVGQSFMLHQIRKMVGMALAEFKGLAPDGCLKYALRARHRVVVPMAPDLGLFLDETFFHAYNDRWGDVHGVLSADPHREQIQQFKDTQLYPKIAQRDREEQVNDIWLRTVNEAYFKFHSWQSQTPTEIHAAIRAAPKSTPQQRKEEKKRERIEAAQTLEKKRKQVLQSHLEAEFSD